MKRLRQFVFAGEFVFAEFVFAIHLRWVVCLRLVVTLLGIHLHNDPLRLDSGYPQGVSMYNIYIYTYIYIY